MSERFENNTNILNWLLILLATIAVLPATEILNHHCHWHNNCLIGLLDPTKCTWVNMFVQKMYSNNSILEQVSNVLLPVNFCNFIIYEIILNFNITLPLLTSYLLWLYPYFIFKKHKHAYTYQHFHNIYAYYFFISLSIKLYSTEYIVVNKSNDIWYSLSILDPVIQMLWATTIFIFCYIIVKKVGRRNIQ